MQYTKLVCGLALCSAILLDVSAVALEQRADVYQSGVEVDHIAVVVNDDVITRHELNSYLEKIRQQLKKQGTPLPDAKELEKQVLERMIIDMLQLQFAKESGLRIDDAQLDKALGRIAQQNNFASLAEFRAKLAREGVDFKKFREEIRNEITFTRLREREVDSKLVISDNEIENYLLMQSKQSGKSEEMELAHILVQIPEQASAEKIQLSKQRADQAWSQLRGGAQFAQVAAGFSDAKDGLQGGNLGWRSADRLPSIFQEALKNMQSGEISPVLRSPNAFHIIKLLDKRNKDAPVMITQARVRHILIKTSEFMSENEARNRLAEIRRRIEGGADFAEQAKLYSEDGSAVQGGDLGWVSPGVFVADFERAMNTLKIGQLSNPVQTEFGWHLIQVLERRNADVSVEQKKQQASMAIRSFKSDEAYQEWLRQLRDRAFVEYRNAAAK
ncbi:MAG: molecular chaperone SurA [Gallionellales bacterium 35-53-114]|jgi:peptidyl-prolyl cis-trans isomerase SurA|nr:MAG: molecular chaperone SurA [Gallionellales bacterium 35-53-114]OYZ62366.1 MAG: molecular chaperone SurA [Gallionellales bacterium 24-53-125]OZB07406.1 MAG: molecular chaperone SurA [Gallionellales bacterium 39-52-133]HQS59581.1 peptidylprolyl isomerase [Gallionellaceae bacterium]HQS75516.1 peptidylprolyl isomerase [Gallionellaceae bacterium]